jgi:signal transduction histidine kinase
MKSAILVIDDDTDALGLCRAHLERAMPDSEVCTASTATQGLALARERHPDLILLDARMPRMDGFEACRCLKQDDVTRDIPVLFLSASMGAVEERMDAYRCGADGFIRKPYDGRELAAQVRATLDLSGHNELRLLRQALNEERARIEASRQNFFNLVESSPDGFLILSREGGLTFANRIAEEVFCIASRVPEDLVNDVLVNGRKAFETTIQKGEGSLTVEVRVVPTLWEGEPVHLVCLRDITERKTMELQLRQQQRLEAIGTLAGGVAHEINNPINGIMNYAQLILDGMPEHSPLGVYAEGIIQETERVAGIVRNLLAFARRDREPRGMVSVEHTLHDALSLIRTVIRHDQITLTVSLAEGLPMVRGRAQQLQQVFVNLLTNARDALNERFPGHDPDKQILVDASCEDRSCEPWVCVSVTDRGCGMSRQVLARILDPFFTTKPLGVGTGLGLSISHGIVQEHGGALKVTSEQGKGSCFRVELPGIPRGGREE